MAAAVPELPTELAGFTLARLVRELAMARPDAPAVSTATSTLTFAELDRRGVRAGDRVALLDRNAPTFYDLLFATAKLGAVLVGLNFRLAPAELAAIVADAGPALTVVAPEYRGALPPDLATVELGPAFEALLAEAPGDADEPDAAGPDDVALLLYSSGTTGEPKGVMVTHANLAWTVLMGRQHYGMGSDSVNLVPSPLFHVGGVGYSLTALGQGGHTVLVRDVDPADVLRLIAQYGVTHTFLVPAVVQMLAEHPDLAGTDLSTLTRIAYGAAPMSEAGLLRAIDAFGCDFMGVYGMTETAGTVVALEPADHDPGGPRAGLLRSVGRPLPYLSVRVVDPLTGVDAAPGRVGEIQVRAGQNMLGYWNRPELTSATVDTDGWLRTGDAAYVNAEGYVFMHDRIKDMVVSGGENIYPAEIENVLSAHPDVQELAVIGVPSVRWGETVKAIVVRRPGSTVSAEQLIAWVRERLAHYKCPTSVDFVEVLPRNATGKVQKHRLREPFWADLDRAVH